MKRLIVGLTVVLSLALACLALERRSAQAGRLVTVTYQIVSSTNRTLLVNGSPPTGIGVDYSPNDTLEIQGSGSGSVTLGRFEDSVEVEERSCTAENVSANTLSYDWVEVFD